MTQITITLKQIRDVSPCSRLWGRVLAANGGDKADFNKPFPMFSILDSNNLDDTIWLFQCLSEYYLLWVKFSYWCTTQVVDSSVSNEVSSEELKAIWSAARYSRSAARSAARYSRSAARSAAADSTTIRFNQETKLNQILKSGVWEDG